MFMKSRVWFFFLLCSFWVASPKACRAIDPSITANVKLDLGSFAIETNPSLLVTQQILTSGIDARSILEFPLTSIPSGTAITAATLDLDVSLFSFSGGSFPIVPVFGYAGDGFAEINDAAVTPNLLGASNPITQLGPITIDLSTNYIEGLLGISTHLGLLLIGDANNHQAGFDNFTDTPVLNIAFDFFTPGDFDQDGDVDGGDFLKWQRGESPNVLSSLDLADWQTNFGTTSGPAIAAAAVPEPSSSSLLVCLIVSAWRPRYLRSSR